MLGFRSSLFISILLVTIQLVEIRCKRSFIVVAPKEYDVGSKEIIHVTLLDVDTPGTVSIKLLNETGALLSESNQEFEGEGSKKVELEVPESLNTEALSSYSYREHRLQVSGVFGDYVFDKNDTVTIRSTQQLVFINTDKPFYKAGQTVKLRVLTVNSDLKPLKEEPIGSIWITNPHRIRIAQWMNITLENGFVHQELELPEEPDLGLWSLHVQIDKIYRVKTFRVKEYVLPTFKVEITPPTYFLQKQEEVTWKICAKYTYGKPVQGKLKTEIKLSRIYYSKEGPTITKEQEFDGCQEITANVTQLYEYRIYGRPGVQMFAEVTEGGTDLKENATSLIYPSGTEFSIAREGNLQYFKAGIPFNMKIKVRKPDSTPLQNKEMRACVVIKREYWRKDRQMIDYGNVCKNYVTDEGGNFNVTIPPQSSNVLEMNAEIRSTDENQENSPTARFTLIPWFSPNGYYLQIKPLNYEVECEKEVEFSVFYTSKEFETRKVYYQVMSKGDVVHDGILTYTFDPKDDLGSYRDETYLSEEGKLNCEGNQAWDNSYPILSYVGKFTLKLNVDFKMSPRARLILYSVTEEGNVLADATSFNVKPCFRNQVEMKFSDAKQFPGAKTAIQLSAEPQSVCSIGVVDKSVFLMEEVDVLTKSKIYDQIRHLDTSEYARPYQKTSDYDYCLKKARVNNSNTNYMEPLGFVDAITAFTNAGVMVLTDLELETRPCKPSFSWGGRNGLRPCVENGRPYPPPHTTTYHAYPQSSFSSSKVGGIQPVALSGVPGSQGFSGGFGPVSDIADRNEVNRFGEPLSTVRTFFPETWLWGIYFVGKEGEIFLKEKMPDSITEWQGNSVCLHPDKGLGVSDSANIVAFQPFFTSLTLPYSVIRGETVPIIVTVFNYLKECLPIRVHLDQTDDFELHNGTLLAKECVCGDKSVTKRFFIKPKTLGVVNITVSASTIKDDEVCENLDVADISRSDTLTKPLIVEAEGFPKEEVKNIFFCMEDVKDGVFKNEHDILRREDVVEGSDRAFVSVTGDVMGPSLEGLENLVRVPTGCGEQNMVKLVPNIVVLDYLTSTNRIKESIRQKAVNHINKGYSRQQNYKHTDGSYSAFGKLDQSGSMWLTAFVVRSFASASRYVDIDLTDLMKSRHWILSHQEQNGCFPVIGMVHNLQLKGGVRREKTPAILTAYVLTSLILSGNVSQAVIDKANQCIQAMNDPSDYARSIFAYAATLTDESTAAAHLEELEKTSVTEGFNRYWSNKDKSIAIETASYYMLAALEMKEGDYFQKVGPVARWLALQRNAYGGFVSTQDTVMALGALAKYAARINRQQLNMGVAVKGNDLDEIFQLDEGNELLMQRIRVPSLPTAVEIEAKGQGCALVQVVLRYNVPNSEASENFVLSVNSERNEHDCKRTKINVCASLRTAQNESNMVVLEMKMVSGFAVDRETVQELLGLPDLEIKRFEIKNNHLNLYFTKLTDQMKCFNFDAIQELVVEDTKPAIVKIYDYYDQGEMSTVSYNIQEECRS